jgi:DNA-binding NtrC family response regulator
LFLDEIAELPLATQAKLLRALETGRVTPVGSEREVVARPRVVAATHRDLEAMVREGGFREDLLHRLSVLVLAIPPLRARADDVKLLLQHFAALAARELGRPVILDPSAIKAAGACSWPGNVRALRNAVLRAAALHEGRIDGVGLLDGVHAPCIERSLAGAPPEAIAVPRADYATMNRALIEAVVAEAGSVRKASRTLGVPRSTLGAWLKRG